MATINLGTPSIATVQKVGNKLKEDGVAFASKADNIASASEFISNLIRNTFKFDTFCRFDSIDGLETNATYQFVNKIFEDKESFVKQSNNLARHLYDQSTHPAIPNGEFYIIYIENCAIDGHNVDALLLLKIEAKDSFLMVSYENGEYSIKPQIGLSTRHIDKGCLVFNTDKEDGYLLSVVETSTMRQDGKYWFNNFLYATEIISDFKHTELVANFCASFVRQISEQIPDKAMDLAKVSRKIAQQLQKRGVEINTEEIISSLGINEEISLLLPKFRSEYEKTIGEIPESFICSPDAVKRKAITKSNVLKIGSNFEIKILDSTAIIEQGFDNNKGLNYIKLFYF